MFSLSDGLYFERLPGGAVRIMHARPGTTYEANGAPTQVDVHCVVSPEGWAELIASMSERGDEPEVFQEALAIHLLEPELLE